MKKSIIATAALAAASISTTVAHADTIFDPTVDNAGGLRTEQNQPKVPTTDVKTDPALVEKEAPKPVEVKAPTKEEVAELGATAKQTQEDADKAKETVAQKDDVVKGAESTVKEKQENVEKAEKELPTPEQVKQAEQGVETAKGEVTQAEKAVSTAKNATIVSADEVAAQEKAVATKQAEVDEAKGALEKAEKEAAEKEAILNDTKLPEARKAQTDARFEEQDAKSSVDSNEKRVEEAKPKEQEYQNSVKEFESQIATSTKEIEDLNKTKADAQIAYAEANKKYDEAGDYNSKIRATHLPEITLDPSFVQAVKDTIAYNLADNSALSTEERNKRTTELYNRVVRTQVANANNKYVQTKNELEDTTRYDINNLPKEIRDELNYFVADLLNQARKQLGLPDAVLSKTSLEFAQKIADEYVKANYSNSMRQEYRKKGGSGHYAKGINKVAKEYNMPTTDSEVEARGGQYYENSVTTFASHDFDDEDGVYRKTLGEMKETLYNHFVQLISTKNDYAHTQGILQFDYPNETAYFGGVAQSKTDDFYTTHFLTSVRSSLTNGSTWDTTPIENPLKKEVFERRVADAVQRLKDTAKAVGAVREQIEAADKGLEKANSTLRSATVKLNALKKEGSPLAKAQTYLERAKTRHDKAVVDLANANALVNNLLVSHAQKEIEARSARGRANIAKFSFGQANKALEIEQAKLDSMKVSAEAKAKAVSEAEQALTDAQAKVKQAEKELANLKGAKTRLVDLKVELEQVEKALQVAQKAQREAKADFEVKSAKALEAKNVYETAKAKFEEAETKRLVELADAKRKELEKAGYKPVPVVDNNGHVVDYKVPQATVTVANGSNSASTTTTATSTSGFVAQSDVAPTVYSATPATEQGETLVQPSAVEQRQLPNTGETSSVLATFGIFGLLVGFTGFKSRKEN